MSNGSIDDISNAHQEELAKLKSGRIGSLRLVLLGVVAIIAISFVVASLPGNVQGREGLERARQDLLASGETWSRNLSTAQRSYQVWLSQHGLGVERQLFEQLSQLIFFSASRVGGGNRGLSFFANMGVTIHFAVLRVAFVLIACWRVWLTAMIAAAIWRRRGWKVYDGADILGQMGNGQLFYSGLRAGLERRSESGAPEMQVTGLACPKMASETEADVSGLGRELKRRGAWNATNRDLTRVIIAHADWPAYVALSEEESLLASQFEGAKLATQTQEVVSLLLKLHAEYRTETGDEVPELIAGHFQGSEVADEKVSAGEYVWALAQACHRVLTPGLRAALAEMPAAQLATIIVSAFAGKVMAYGAHGGKWARRSNFPELCSRAILHAMPPLAEEYDFEARSGIRRSLIYGSRKSVFAPVRFPVDLAPQTRAARQWVELMLAMPFELQAIADEVELIGRLHEMHQAWSQQFFDGAITLSSEVVESTFSTMSNLFLMPVEKIVQLSTRIISADTLERVEQLVQQVSQKQRLQNMSLETSEAAGEKGALHMQGKFSAPLSSTEIRRISELHGIPGAPLKYWSAVRAMLNHYGWLARRVGDYTVPDNGIIFAVMRFDSPVEGANDLGLLGRSGMVAFRGSRLETKWGKHWHSRFVQAQAATMGETREEFEKLMKGIREEVLEEPVGPTTAIG